MGSISKIQFLEMCRRLHQNSGGTEKAEFEPVKREAGLHDQIITECRRRGWPYIHSRMDQMSTISVGCPDFVIFADGGRVFPVECKTKIGKLSTEQLGWQLMLGRCGHKYYVVRAIEQFLEIVKGDA